MQRLAMVLLILVPTSLIAQVRTESPVPFEDTILVSQGAPLGNVPVIGNLFRSNQTYLTSNRGIPLQQTIDKVVSNATTLLVMDLDAVILASAMKSLDDSQEETRKLLRGLKSIQVRWFDVSGEVQGKLQPIRDALRTPQWVRYAAYTSDDNEVEIWSGRIANAPSGVFVLVANGKRVFAMNVAGDLLPNQLVLLSDIFGLPRIAMPFERAPSKAPVGK